MPRYWHPLFGFFTVEPRRRSRTEKAPEENQAKQTHQRIPAETTGTQDKLPPDSTIISTNILATAAEPSPTSTTPQLLGGQFEPVAPGIFRFRSPKSAAKGEVEASTSVKTFSLPPPSAFEKTSETRDGLSIYRFR